MLVWLSVWRQVQTCIWPSWCHCHSLSLASVKSRLVLPFWYRPTRVVPDKGPLNGCECVYTEPSLCWVSSIGSQRDASCNSCWAPAPVALRPQLSINICYRCRRSAANPPAAVAVVDRRWRQTKWQTPDCYIDPALHIMQAASIGNTEMLNQCFDTARNMAACSL